MSQPSSAPYPASTGDVTATTVAAMAPTTAAPVTCHSARTERGSCAAAGRRPAPGPHRSRRTTSWVVVYPAETRDPQTVALAGGGEEPPKRLSSRLLLCWLLRLPRRARIPAAAALLTGISRLFATVPVPGGGHP